jgi:hypothetical protein
MEGRTARENVLGCGLLTGRRTSGAATAFGSIADRDPRAQAEQERSESD